MMPEKSEKVNDEFSGSKWTGMVGKEKYQIRFDPENNICRIYRWEDTFDPNWKKWGFTQFSYFRKNEDGKILFDGKPSIDYAESYSIKTYWKDIYALTKKFYEDNKKVFENTKSPKAKEIAKENMERYKKAVEQLATVESFEKGLKNHGKEIDKDFQRYKKDYSEEAAGIQAVNPVTGSLSADKKTLTVKKMFIGFKRDDTPEYAENVVFTRE